MFHNPQKLLQHIIICFWQAHGSSWQHLTDPCATCKCDYGTIKCEATVVCPPLFCTEGRKPFTPEGECCQICGDSPTGNSFERTNSFAAYFWYPTSHLSLLRVHLSFDSSDNKSGRILQCIHRYIYFHYRAIRCLQCRKGYPLQRTSASAHSAQATPYTRVCQTFLLFFMRQRELQTAWASGILSPVLQGHGLGEQNHTTKSANNGT